LDLWVLQGNQAVLEILDHQVQQEKLVQLAWLEREVPLVHKECKVSLDPLESLGHQELRVLEAFLDPKVCKEILAQLVDLESQDHLV